MDKSKRQPDVMAAPSSSVPPATPAGRVRVRVLGEFYGTPRAPIARRGDELEISVEEFKAAPGVFEDLDATARAANPEPLPPDPWVENMRAALRADREAGAQARAITAAREAERATAAAEHFRNIAKKGA